MDSRLGSANEGHPGRAAITASLLVVGVVVAVGAWRSRAAVGGPQLEVDLATYLAAFDRAAAGLSPYEDPGYLYPPAFAMLGGMLRELLGAELFLQAFRSSILVGVGLLVAASLAPTRLSLISRLALAVLAGLLPPVANGVGCGNVTPILVGPILYLLRLSERFPRLAGAMLGLLHGLKPLALPALAVTAMVPLREPEPPDRVRPPWRPFLGAALGAALATLLLGARHLPEMLSRAGGFPDAFYNLGLVRALGLVGLRLPAIVVFLAMSTAGLAFARRFVRSGAERAAIALATSLFALPVIGTSGYLLSLPLQALALDRMAAALRQARTMPRFPRSVLAESTLVLAVLVSIGGAEGGVAAADLGPVLHGIVMLIPFLDVAALAVYVLVLRPEVMGAVPRHAAIRPG